MPEIIKLSIFLAFVAAVAGAGLSYVNKTTSPLIEKQILQNKIESFKEVYPDGDKVLDKSADYLKVGANPLIKEVDIAYKNGAATGVIYAVEPRGYAAPISILAGFDIASKRIVAIKILSQKETPGLGAKSKDKEFQDRYKSKNASEELVVVKSQPSKESQIQAITASTITSKAVTKGVNAAREHFIANFSGGKQP